MKVTKENGKIIIELEQKDNMVDSIISMVKDFEEAHRRGSEINRSLGFIGAAVIDEVRADTAYQILQRIEKILNK